MSAFEIVMLICFGAAWPASIYKSWRSKQTAGKSVLFLFLVLIGYASGVMHKLMYNYDGVIYLYIANFVMVAIDILLYWYNSLVAERHNRRAEDNYL